MGRHSGCYVMRIYLAKAQSEVRLALKHLALGIPQGGMQPQGGLQPF